ncbi:MAG: DUF3631 domain-containing protein [Stellaceae bacterium]
MSADPGGSDDTLRKALALFGTAAVLEHRAKFEGADPAADAEIVARAAAAERARIVEDLTPKPGAGADGKDTLDDNAGEAEIVHLSQLKPLAYARQRAAAATEIGIPVAMLDKLVKTKQQETAAPAQGRAIELPEPEPWPEAVNGAALLTEIAAAVRRFMVMENGAHEIVALWVLHAHALDAFQISPRLAITSPRPSCGKTTLLDILKCLVPRPLLTANVTVAAVFRTVEIASPVLLADEADTWLRENDELRGILNSGHRRGGNIIRVVGEDFEARQFSVWGACAIAMIGRLPGTLADRSLSISLKRKRPDEVVEQFRFDRTKELDDLASKAARWAADNVKRLAGMDPAVPTNLDNRGADNWRPALAIADAAGDTWPKLAREIAAATVDADQAKRASLLADIRDIFAARNLEQIKSADLVEVLVAIEGSDWAEYGRAGKPITKNQLAKVLARDGISPGTIRLGSGPRDTAKGYGLAQFADAFARYLPDPLNPTVTPSQGAENLAFPGNLDPSQGDRCDVSKSAGKPKVSAGCDGVTDENALPDDDPWPAIPPFLDRRRGRMI